MSEPASISAGIAGRYASAIFDLAKDANDLKRLEADTEALALVLSQNADVRDLIGSPVYSRTDQGNAISAIAAKMGLSDTFKGALGLMATKRRLFVLPQLVASLRAMIADEKGEVTADVVAAQELTKAQADKLAASLKQTVGKTVKLNISVDDTLIGGLVVKVGSKMIDTSIRSKLASLQNAMKEVG